MLSGLWLFGVTNEAWYPSLRLAVVPQTGSQVSGLADVHGLCIREKVDPRLLRDGAVFISTRNWRDEQLNEQAFHAADRVVELAKPVLVD